MRHSADPADPPTIMKRAGGLRLLTSGGDEQEARALPARLCDASRARADARPSACGLAGRR